MTDVNVAIVGGAGFLGSRLVRRFRENGVSYRIFDLEFPESADSECGYIDVETPSSLGVLSGHDCIVNLAAVHRDDVRPRSRYDDVNVKGAQNICQAARDNGIQKIIFTSSVAIYGFAPPETSESGEANFFNDYGRTKHLAECIYKNWYQEDPRNRTLVIVRPTVIFGEGNRGNVYNLLKQIASGRFLMIGNGRNKKSMAYVENVAAFLEYSLMFQPGLHLFNYIDKPDLDMNTLVRTARMVLFGKNNVGFRLPAAFGMSIGLLADLLSKISNKSFSISSIRVKKFVSTTQFSSSVGATGFIAPTSLPDALERTLAYEFIEDNSDKQVFETE